MSDRYEIFVRWYLRFNGYFCVENYVLHEPVGRGVLQGGEFDVLAVRFPYSRERVPAWDEHLPGFAIEDDARLDIAHDTRLGLNADDGTNLIDFVIAEIKSGGPGLNDLWQAPRTDEEKAQRYARLAATVGWMGPLRDETVIREVATELQTRHWSRRDLYLFRLLYFARAPHDEVGRLGIPQITFTDIVRWIVEVRTSCYPEHGFGARSSHPQWHPMINEIWRFGNEPGRTPEEKMQQILAVLDGSSS